MNTLQGLLDQPLVTVLGWALIHFIWQGTLVAVVLACVLRTTLQGRSTNTRYAAACAALLLMSVLPPATIAIIRISMPDKIVTELSPVLITQPVSQPPQVETEPETPPIQAEIATALPHRLSVSLAPLLPLIILLWLLGVTFFALRLLAAWFCTERLKSHGACLLEENWQQALRRICRQLGVTRPVRLLESALVKVPTVIGWLSPVILLPIGALSGLTPQQLEAIIAHELAHIRRHDYLINLLQAVIETLLFYHPAVWWVSRRIRQEREHCCDDLAVAVCGDALTYARALLEMEQLRAAGPQLAVAANGGVLMNRIQRLVGIETPQTNRFAGLVAGIVLISVVVSVGVGAQILLPSFDKGDRSIDRMSKQEAKGIGRMAGVSQVLSPDEHFVADHAHASVQGDRAAEALVPALQSTSWEVRKTAVETLARLSSSRATELLVAALRDTHPQVREQAVIGLGKRSNELAVEHLIAALTDNDWPVREQAAIARVVEDLPVREEITHRYQLSPAARVEVSYILGSVEIEGTDGDVAEVTIVRSANTQADLDRFDRIHIEQTPSRLVLRGEDSKSGGIEIRHRIHLRLPRNSRIELREINGRVHIKNLEGAIRLNEINGGALIPRLTGELEMISVNGGINLGLARLVPSGIRLQDVGSVELSIADGVNAELEIDELDASPLLDTPLLTIMDRIGEKKFHGRIGAGGPVIRIDDVKGPVRIRQE